MHIYFELKKKSRQKWKYASDILLEYRIEKNVLYITSTYPDHSLNLPRKGQYYAIADRSF